MATHDYNIANQSGADFRADLNNALSAILSNNASATEPTTTTAYMLWVDTGNNLLKMRNSDDNAWITLPVSITTSNTVDIDGGTVNTITSLSFSSGETVTTILDEDDLSSDSASALATQQSIKAYVDSQVTAQDLDFQGDTGGALSIDLDSETFTISGGNGIDTSGALNTLTIAIDSSVVTITDTQTLTNKTIDADSNTISNLEVDNLKSGVLDTDLTSVSASDDTLASSKAIKTYVDAQVTAQDLDLTDGTTSISIDLDSEELSVLGGTGVTSTASGNGVTLAIGQDVGTTADVTFNTVSADLTGDVTGTVSSIANHSTSDLTEGTNLYYTTARFDSAFSGKSTSDLTEGTNLYFTDERVDDRVNNLLVAGSNVTLTYDDVANTLTIAATEDNLSNNDTDDLAEGSTNLYFTDARARAAISVSGDLSYNSTTGVISFTERTDAEVRGLVSASGDLSYNSTTGVFSFTERTDAEVRGLISGGTGVTYNNTTGVISIGQAVGTSDNVTFGDVIVSGDLTVSGTTTTVNTETINLADNIILFNSNATGTPTENAGIEIERGDATNKTLLWNETDDKWTVGSETFVAGTFEGALTGNVTGTVSSLANHDTDDLSEGATNLYYTDARVDSHLSGGTGVTYSSGTISIGQSVGTGDSVTFAGVSSDFTGDIDGAVKFTAKADVALTKGQVVYISGISGAVPTVNLADADNASAMPAFGLVYANANANAEVEIITFGSLADFDTSGFSVGDTVYVSTTAGALTATPPTGESSLIQNIGIVQRSHASAGIIKVGGAGRTNATPNLNSGKIFYGNGSNQSVATTLDTSIVPESGNLYYTDARARSAISVSGNALSYNSSTGVITSNYEESPTFTGTVTAAGLTVSSISYPTTDGTSGQVLTTDGAGTLSFSTISGYSDSDVESYLDTGTSTPTFASVIVSGDLTVDTSTLYVDSTNNRVGVGTTSPSANLHVSGGNPVIYIQDSNNTTSQTGLVSAIQGYDSASTKIWGFGRKFGSTALQIENDEASSILFNQGGSEIARFDGSGQLGINTSSPATFLHVKAGSNSTTDFPITIENAADSLDVGIGAYGMSNKVGTSQTSDFTITVGDDLYLAADTVRLPDGADLIVQENDSTTSAIRLASDADEGFLQVYTGGVQKVQIRANGDNYIIDNNFGIGTNTPSSIFHIDMGTPDIVAELSADSPTFTYRNGAGAWFHAGKHPTNDYFYIGRGATTTTDIDMVVDNSGKVGINVTSPSATLDVDGTIKLDGNYPTGTGNVALGNTALDSGSLSGNYNTAIGSAALTANTTGLANIALGASTLLASTTGSYNIAIGYLAASSITTGVNNVAIGREALQAETTGGNGVAVGYRSLYSQALSAGGNTGLGYQSLYSSTTAANNTAVGYNSLYANTTGTLNVAVGALALDANTTGSYNTALGYFAMSANTTGGFNTAVGAYAFNESSSGSNNTVMGYGAMYKNSTGYNNTALGYAALDKNTTGYSNTAVGFGSLDANTTGIQNTAIGQSSLTDNSTGSYNTAVGLSALGSNTTANNNNAFGFYALSSNTTGSANNAFGFYALLNCTTPNHNSAFGSSALQATTTGATNSAFGSNALLANTTGNNNVCMGYTSGDAITTGSSNTFYGTGSGSDTINTTTGSGNVLIGAFSHTSAAGDNYANGIGYGISAAGGYTTVGLGVDDIRAAHGVATWSTVSDERVKKDIQDSEAGLSFINDLRPRIFKYKTKGDLPKEFDSYEEGSTEVYKNSKTNHGFIAQEVKEAIEKHPELKDGFRMWDVRETGQQEVGETAVIPILVKAVQELSAKCDSLQAEINILKGE